MVVSFRDASKLLFVDVRRFGRVWGLKDLDPDHPDAAMEAGGMTPLGPEPLSLSAKTFATTLQTTRPIKALLLDQTRIAGLGNIYVDESLWAARIHPARACSSLTSEETAALLREIKRVLRRAIRAGGTTFSDYRNAYGDMGRFRARLRAYQRHGQPCKRCGATLERLVIAGRGTHICPCCQAR
jgi:formamidopyrimidine-DNA glycosylase